MYGLDGQLAQLLVIGTGLAGVIGNGTKTRIDYYSLRRIDMIKLNWQQLLHDHVWFGWYYRDWNYSIEGWKDPQWRLTSVWSARFIPMTNRKAKR